MTHPLRLESPLPPAHETDFVSISVDEARSLLLLVWRRQISLHERKSGFGEALRLTRAHHLKYWLVDDSELPVITQPEKEWILSEFQAEASQTSIQRLAVVIADFYPSLTANTDFTAKGKAGYKDKGVILHEVFPDYESALIWLLAEDEADQQN